MHRHSAPPWEAALIKRDTNSSSGRSTRRCGMPTSPTSTGPRCGAHRSVMSPAGCSTLRRSLTDRNTRAVKTSATLSQVMVPASKDAVRSS